MQNSTFLHSIGERLEMFRLDNKIAVITGAATGLGAAISITLAQQGAHVAVSDKSDRDLTDTVQKAKKYNHQVFAFDMDVRVMSEIHKGIQLVQQEFGRIDILVSNAGINRPRNSLDVDEDNWGDHYKTNVKGGFFVAQAAAKLMISQKWGRIIFIASQSGLVGIPGQSVYCSTKGALIQLTRTLGLEWAKYGITVNAVAPTFVETNLTRKRLQNSQFLEFVLRKIPIGKLALPEDVASAVVYLASEEAKMVNCAVLSVDGGWTAW